MKKLTAFSIVCVAITVAAAMPTHALAAPPQARLAPEPACAGVEAGRTDHSTSRARLAEVLPGQVDAIAVPYSAG